MVRLLIIKCWITRHHWLLQKQESRPQDWPNKTFTYHYKCTVCDKTLKQIVEHLS